MAPIPRILVAIKNPWARALPGADKALQLARALGAEVRLFHGLTDPVLVDVRQIQSLAGLEQERRERVLERLTTVARRLGGRVRVTAAAEWDFPASEAVIRAAQRFRATLIVAGPHAGAHHMPWLLRFTDLELLRRSPVPVLLVKTRSPYERPVVLVALDPSLARAKPAGLDALILRHGSTVARALRGELHAIHAFQPSPLSAMFTPADTAGGARTRMAQSSARAALDRTVRAAAVARSRTHLVARHRVEAIERVAREIRAAIVVMGAVGRSPPRRWVSGNTSEKLLDRLACDVLVVKPRGFANRISPAARGVQMIAHSGVQSGY